MPPPLLHTRSGNEIYESPHTPTGNAFTSPVQTPIGSPSKKQLPPGANDLPNVFDNALQLGPMSPKAQGMLSSKQALSMADDNVNRDPFADPASQRPPVESPARQSNKENAPNNGLKLGRDPAYQQNQAAISRQEPYQPAESRRGPLVRGLSAEDLQKIQQPRVKRLVNVTQLCKSPQCKSSSKSPLTNQKTSWITTLISFPTFIIDSHANSPSKHPILLHRIRQMKSMSPRFRNTSAASARIYASVEPDSGMATSRSSPRSVKVGTVRFTLHRRKIPRRCAP